MYCIEDELHAEVAGEFSTFAQALAELQRRAVLPWDQPPNLAPCTSWATCGRDYEVIEYDSAQEPWREVRRVSVLSVSARGAVWASGFTAPPSATPNA